MGVRSWAIHGLLVRQRVQIPMDTCRMSRHDVQNRSASNTVQAQLAVRLMSNHATDIIR